MVLLVVRAGLEVNMKVATKRLLDGPEGIAKFYFLQGRGYRGGYQFNSIWNQFLLLRPQELENPRLIKATKSS